MNRFCLALCFALAIVAGCANYDPASVRLAAGSTDKAVLLLEINSHAGADFQFHVVRFDEANHTVLNNSFQGYAVFSIDPGTRYVAQTVDPGTYVMSDISQQWYWVACLHADTLAFDVKPGEVLFLGRLNPMPQLHHIQEQARLHGDMTTQSFRFYLDDVPPPVVEFVGGPEKQLADIQTYVKTSMPKVSGPVRLADYRPARFGTGYSLFGDRVCTGYFKNKVK